MIYERCGVVGFSSQSAWKVKLKGYHVYLDAGFGRNDVYLKISGKRSEQCPNCREQGLIPLRLPQLQSILKMFNLNTQVSKSYGPVK